MHNPVVEAVVRTYGAAGYTTLRFNFRGVGGSQGAYGQGMGEEHDVQAALAWLGGLGVVCVDLVGYSFGAWVAALAAQHSPAVQRLVLVAPPLGVLDFGPIRALPRLALVIVGANDTIAGMEQVRAAVPQWNRSARLAIVAGTDHFFAGAIDSLCRELGALL